MRSVRRTLRGPSVLPKTQRNHANLLGTLSQRCGEGKSISILKIDTDAGVAFVTGDLYIISIKDSEGSMLVSAHASTVYAV